MLKIASDLTPFAREISSGKDGAIKSVEETHFMELFSSSMAISRSPKARPSRFLVNLVLLVAFAIAPTASWAADYCVTFPTVPDYVLVGRGFIIPLKGKCRTWTGFALQSGSNSPTSGTGCTSSDGSNLTLGLTTMQGTAVIFDAVSLALPSQAGSDNENAVNGVPVSAAATGAHCTVASHPIPAVTSEQTSATTSIGLQSNP
jgi:hypothetical protein